MKKQLLNFGICGLFIALMIGAGSCEPTPIPDDSKDDPQEQPKDSIPDNPQEPQDSLQGPQSLNLSLFEELNQG